MANLMDLLQGQLQNGLLDQLRDKLPGATKEETASATNLAVTTLLSALTKNAQSKDGLSSLMGALNGAHDGSLLDNIAGLLGGELQGNKAADGIGILSHLLGGGNIFNIVNMISKGSKMSRNNTMQLLMMLAPIVLGMLGKQKKKANLEADGVQDFLVKSKQDVRQQMPQQSLIEKLLNSDGDGSIVDEIAGIGMSVLGNLFRR